MIPAIDWVSEFIDDGASDVGTFPADMFSGLTEAMVRAAAARVATNESVPKPPEGIRLALDFVSPRGFGGYDKAIDLSSGVRLDDKLRVIDKLPFFGVPDSTFDGHRLSRGHRGSVGNRENRKSLAG